MADQDQFIEVARVGELQPEEMKAFEVDGKRLLLVFAEGEYFVVDEMCTHEDYSLALGCIKGGRIKCSLHGSYFDLRTGEPDEEPADEPICSYAVRVDDDRVLVDTNKKRP
jgi:3-phenylpropionate/trans-cinnamate dioxygenase ferredoxin subunit